MGGMRYAVSGVKREILLFRKQILYLGSISTRCLMGNFMDLNVWKESRLLVVEICKVTRLGEFATDFGFRDQIRRSAVSIISNIAEGEQSGTNKLSLRFLRISRGSTGELLTQLIIAKDVGYIDENQYNELYDRCDHISAMLQNLIKVREKRTPV
jgi:four helix bundle protein